MDTAESSISAKAEELVNSYLSATLFSCPVTTAAVCYLPSCSCGYTIQPMDRGQILKILQNDVDAATKVLKLADDRLAEIYQQNSSELTGIGWVLRASAEKSSAVEKLRLALRRLH